MKKIFLWLIILCFSVCEITQAAFYEDASRYILLEDNIVGYFYLDKATIKKETSTANDSFVISFDILSVLRENREIEKTHFTVFYDNHISVAMYKVDYIETIDSHGEVQFTSWSSNVGSIRKAIPFKSHMYYIVDACYEYLTGNHFYKTHVLYQ